MIDGSSPSGILEPDYLFDGVFAGLAKEQLPPLGASLWNAAVRKTLTEIAGKIDHHIVVSYSNDTGPEFLLDLIWFKPAGRPGCKW